MSPWKPPPKKSLYCAIVILLRVFQGSKDISSEELDVKKVVQSSLVAKGLIKQGESISEEMLVEKRPSTGISPMDIDKVIGRIVLKDIEKDEVLKYEYFKQ